MRKADTKIVLSHTCEKYKSNNMSAETECKAFFLWMHSRTHLVWIYASENGMVGIYLVILNIQTLFFLSCRLHECVNDRILNYNLLLEITTIRIHFNRLNCVGRKEKQQQQQQLENASIVNTNGNWELLFCMFYHRFTVITNTWMHAHTQTQAISTNKFENASWIIVAVCGII